MSTKKICAVCGDKALGYNFNAISCESCKAFFRRNALIKKEFICPFNQICIMNVVTRRFCQKCRLRKCFEVGMKSDNIMSDEDKYVKRRKIELNRSKRSSRGKDDKEIVYKVNNSDNETNQRNISDSNCSKNEQIDLYENRQGNELSATEIVDSIVSIPERGTQTINYLMKNPKEAVEVMEKVINSKADALRLISHLISYPGDALKIISKIMNSPFDALTVFTKFMSSPTDALEIISKVVNSPQDVLKFLTQLMDSPEDANAIMNKFMNSPAEALKIINKMVNGMKERKCEPERKELILQCPAKNKTRSEESTIINAMLDNASSASSEHSASNDSVTLMDDTRSNLFYNIFGNTTNTEHENPLESVLLEVIRLEYQTIDSLQTCYTKPELSDIEHSRLNELKAASETLYLPLDEDICNLFGGTKSEEEQQSQTLLKVINLTAVAIKRLIKMSKKIGAFRNMCQEDQVALLKGGCTEMMIMRSVMSYDCDRATWKIPHSKENMSNIKVDVLKLAKGNVYEEHDRFIRTFHPKWRMDENIVLIMCAILLFKPTRPRVIHSDVIKLEQNSYYYLLRRYLESIYPGCEAKSTFIKLMQKISEVETLNQLIIGVYLNVNPLQIEPLLREIFDLKNH